MTAGTSPLGAALRARGSRFGTLVLSLDCTASTNALARELARWGAPSGSVVLAERQAGGRGRWNRSWASAAGGVYLSVLLRPGPSEELHPELAPLSAAVAVADVLEGVYGIAPRLRWPNDVYASGRKLGGVLCEASFSGDRLDFAVVGIGVNVGQSTGDFPEELRERATSVLLLTGRSPEPSETATAILMALEERLLGAGRGGASLARFRELSDGLEGSPVRVVSREGESVEATSDGLADDGALRVKLADGTSRRLYSEDVVLLRPVHEPSG